MITYPYEIRFTENDFFSSSCSTLTEANREASRLAASTKKSVKVVKVLTTYTVVPQEPRIVKEIMG